MNPLLAFALGWLCALAMVALAVFVWRTFNPWGDQ
jgi:hypothetical protein